MQLLSTEHVAELLVGIARAQAAIVKGLESEASVVRALEAAAHLRDRPQPTLADLPVRALIASLQRAGADTGAIARELERLCAGPARPAAPVDPQPTDYNP